MDNLKTIDFSKTHFEIVGDYSNIASCTIDEKINVLYQHYIQDEKYFIPTKIDIDVYYNNILEYTKEKYYARLGRMNWQDEIYFVLHQIHDKEGFNITSDECREFINKRTPYRKILATDDKSLLRIKSNNTLIVSCMRTDTTGKVAEEILRRMMRNHVRLDALRFY